LNFFALENRAADARQIDTEQHPSIGVTTVLSIIGTGSCHEGVYFHLNRVLSTPLHWKLLLSWRGEEMK